MKLLIAQAVAQWLTDHNIAYFLREGVDEEDISEILQIVIPGGVLDLEITAATLAAVRFDDDPDDSKRLIGGWLVLTKEVEDPKMFDHLHALLTELGVTTNDQHA